MSQQDDQKKIAAVLAVLDDDGKRRHSEAVAEGYKDEVCSKCGAVLLAFHHFLRCDREDCPMKLRDKNGHAPNFFEMMENGVPDQSYKK
jgi:hypothetical protein